MAALSGSMMADSIWSGSVGSYNTIPTTLTQPTFPSPAVPISTNTQSPFWNNPSADTVNNHTANVGAVLLGLATGTNLIGGDLSGGVVNGSYFAFNTTDNGSGGGNPIAAVTGQSATPGLEFSFVSSATAYNIALLFADSCK